MINCELVRCPGSTTPMHLLEFTRGREVEPPNPKAGLLWLQLLKRKENSSRGLHQRLEVRLRYRTVKSIRALVQGF
jgi:hypothetical protein